jgi:hypothetical protein
MDDPDFKQYRVMCYLCLVAGVTFGILVNGWGFCVVFILIVLGEFAARF